MSAQTPTMREIRNLLDSSLRSPLDLDGVADFLAAVDWGRVDHKSREAALLGQIEGWTTEYTEGELSGAQYRAKLSDALNAVPTG